MPELDSPATVDLPTFAIGPTLWVLGRARRWHQWRRKVGLTVHVANEVLGVDASCNPQVGQENYYINVTNASRERDIVVTHVWLETTPPVHIQDAGAPRQAAL